MTTQIPEVLLVASRQSHFNEEVLPSALANSGAGRAPGCAYYSASWRGYCGYWRLRERRLYLCHLLGEDRFSMEKLFPGHTGEVFAGWFSGHIALPYGPRLAGRTIGRGFAYASYLRIEFESGVVVRTWVDDGKRKPPPADIPDWLRKSLGTPRDVAPEPPPPPTTEGNYMPARVIEALLSAVPPVRAWRQYLGLGEDKLAAMAGLPLAELQAAERRDPALRPDSLRAIARVLGLTLEDLNYG